MKTPLLRLLCFACFASILFSLTVHAAEPKKKKAPKATTAATADDRGLVMVTKASDESGKRVALVIGNGNYRHPESLPRLANPTNDATDIAAALRGFGFEVIEKTNLNKEDMDTAISEFGRKIIHSEAALFYFAGHGLQVKGQNYLIPIDAKIKSEAQIPYNSINVNQLLEEMDNSKSRVNIVMLDACRNNPLSGKFRSGATHGLAAQTSLPKGTVIVYATDPGNVAADGSGRNGMFSAGLLTAFKGSDLSLSGVLTRASEEVERVSAKKQIPYINGPLPLQKTFHFAAPVPAIKTAGAYSSTPEQSAVRIKSNEEIEQEAWESARTSNNLEVIKEYLKQYPTGRFAGQARVLLAAKQSESATYQYADAESTLWAEVEKGKLIEEYEAYLAQYPQGKYSALAKRRIKKLQDEAAAAARTKLKDEAAAAEARRKNEALEASNKQRRAIEAANAEAIKKQQAVQAKAQAKATKIANFNYMENSSRMERSNDPLEKTSSPLGTAFDILTLPSKTSEMEKIKNAAAFRPSTWGKPDSMMARASMYLAANSPKTENTLIEVDTE